MPTGVRFPRGNAPNPASYLASRLIVPVGVAGAVALGVSHLLRRSDRAPWVQDLAMNLAVTALGVLVTVLYVDRITRQHEEQRWASVLGYAKEEMQVVANATLTAFRGAFGITLPFSDLSRLRSSTPSIDVDAT